MTAKRNGKIELLRFIFCICVLLYHINKDLWGGEKLFCDNLSFFSHGRTGVEFFFLVTGYLTAKSAAKLVSADKKSPIGQSTFDFMVKKIKSVLIPHFILCGLICILLIANGKLDFTLFLDKLPSLFFLQTTGLSTKYFLAVEWYLASMFFALVIIYPLLLWNFDVTSKIIAPVGSSIMIGYMISKYGNLPSSFETDPILTPDNLRALAVVLLGVFCYVISEKIKETEFTKVQRYALIAVENICWIASLLYIVSDLNGKYEGIVVYVFALAVSLTFSRNFECKLYNNSFVYYLGRISLTVYLSQNVARNFVQFYFDTSNVMYVVLVTALTILLGVIVDFVCQRINKRKTAK